MGNTKIDEFVRASQHARRGGYKTASALFYRRAGLWFEARVNAIYSAALAEDVVTAKLLLQQYRDRLPTRSAEKICALIRSRLFKQPRPTMGRIRGTSQPLVSVIVPVRNAARYL